MVIANKGKIFISFLILSVGLGYLAFMAFQSATVYYYTVGELQDQSPTSYGKLVRVSGKLVPQSFHRDENSTLAHFSLTDGSASLVAAHDGILPDLFFNEHSEIILEGSSSPNGIFDSQNIIVKCPSKYVAAEDNQEG